jgi:hypothetical protein
MLEITGDASVRGGVRVSLRRAPFGRTGNRSNIAVPVGRDLTHAHAFSSAWTDEWSGNVDTHPKPPLDDAWTKTVSELLPAKKLPELLLKDLTDRGDEATP